MKMNFDFIIKNKVMLIGIIVVLIVISWLLSGEGALDTYMIDNDEIELEELNKDIELITQDEVILDEIFRTLDEITVE